MPPDGREEAYCDTCQRFTPLIEEPLESDDMNVYPWGDLLCGDCYSFTRRSD